MELAPIRFLLRRSIAVDAGLVPLDSEIVAEQADTTDPVIVVGGGPSGLRVAQETARRGLVVILFNAERWRPYNRVKLTPLLAGEVQIGRVYQQSIFEPGSSVVQYDGQTIVAIDPAEKTVTNQFGRRWRYSKLVLCLGSHPYVPPIPGHDLSGVHRFRNFDDVEQLVARAMRSRCTVVIGGGLLGLEAARGMAYRKVDTVVVEHESHLMARQLDLAGGRILETRIRQMGLETRTGCSVRSIGGQERVEHVLLSTGETIGCDTVIICTGIRSNIDLARDAGISIGRGITVNDAMQTSAPDVYSVGECAEHNGQIYGLVAPGLEQAAIAAAHLAGERASYQGSTPTTKLKVIGTDVFSMGDVEQVDQRIDIRTIIWRGDAGQYRRLIIRNFRLVGAIGVGEWPELNRVQQAVRDHAIIPPWRTWHFKRSGRLYAERKPVSVRLWPAAATVCNCTGVSRGQLGDAINTGACTLETLMRETSASTICGTCRPLLQELLGADAVHQPVTGSRWIGVSSLVAVFVALAAWLLPAWPNSSSVVNAGLALDGLWLDSTTKQITGYTLLALSALIAFLSVRKRINLKWLGGYPLWRVAHTLIGVAALAALFFHTGFNLGNNLNRWLMVTFLAVAAVGSATGIVTAREHVALANGKPSRRALFTWLHIITFWPLPVLLVLHVVTVYAY